MSRVAERELTYEDLLRIVELIKTTSHFSEFRLKVGDIEVSLRRANGLMPRAQPAPPSEAVAAPSGATPQTRTERQFPAGMHLVRSPMVGTFYSTPVPGKPPFVEVGQAVQPDTTVCIIEVMKLMNSIAAGAAGVVKEILVANAAPVEYGQALMVIGPKKP
jgi:acetyl-CoA carboxylase biotin carboxyl carrier protein